LAELFRPSDKAGILRDPGLANRLHLAWSQVSQPTDRSLSGLQLGLANSPRRNYRSLAM